MDIINVLIILLFLYGTVSTIRPKKTVEWNPFRKKIEKKYGKIEVDERFINDTKFKGRIMLIAGVVMLVLRYMGKI